MPAIDLNLQLPGALVLKDFRDMIGTAKYRKARKSGKATGNWQPMASLLALPKLHAFLQTVHPSTLQSSCVLDLLVLHLQFLGGGGYLALLQVRYLAPLWPQRVCRPNLYGSKLK